MNDFENHHGSNFSEITARTGFVFLTTLLAIVAGGIFLSLLMVFLP